jgi:hypothetical protein
VASPLPVQFADIAGGAWPAATQLLACLVDAVREPGTCDGGVNRVRTGTRGRSVTVAMADHATAAMLLPHAAESAVCAAAGVAVRDIARWDLLGGVLPCYTMYSAKCGAVAGNGFFLFFCFYCFCCSTTRTPFWP